MDKKQWRHRAATERANVAFDSARFCEGIAGFLDDNIDPRRRVVIYDAIPGEVDLAGLIAVDPNPEGRYAITRTPEQGFELSIHPFGCGLEQHRYGYRQPVSDAPVVADGDIGAVLVPALAFDRHGVRLGRGKGYYDRFLARLGAGPAFIGITGGYVVEQLPAESFDVPMTHLALQSGVVAVPVQLPLPVEGQSGQLMGPG